MIRTRIRKTFVAPKDCARFARVRADVVEASAREVLSAHCSFHGRAESFQLVLQDDVLIVRGAVPSFYLKQLVSGTLKGLNGVRQIENQVAVVSSCGLSSAPEESSCWVALARAA
jgi:hypothetical protein